MLKNFKKILNFMIILSFFATMQACAKKRTGIEAEQMQLNFNLFYQNKILSCDELVKLPVELNEFRFYIHDLIHKTKSLHLVENEFQHNQVAYLDFSATHRYCVTQQ